MIYLASPFSHDMAIVQHERFIAACKAVAALMQRGLHVYSPIVHCYPIHIYCGFSGTYRFWKDYNHHMIQRCGSVYVLTIDGWQESTGVQGEIDFALYSRKPLFFLDPNDYSVKPHNYVTTV